MIGHSESLRAMERVIFCQIEASEGKTFYSTKKKNNLLKHTYNTNNCGGGREEVTGESKLPTSRTVYMNFAFPAPSLVFLAFYL